mmetsp:Transcript_32923/g.32596  ORF Transcript_32923/g.32596 Transcript_32923/m.32596 type:complete len:188 (-) Transcript_32923:19-582(-)
MAELYMMRPLFPGTSEVDQLNRICSVLGTPNDWPEGQRLATQLSYCFPQYIPMPLQELMPNASPDAIDFIKQVLTWDPANRPSADQCLQHPFFTGGIRVQQNFSFLSVDMGPKSAINRVHSLSAENQHNLSEGPHTRSGILIGVGEMRNPSTNIATSRAKIGGGLGQFGASLIGRQNGNIGMGRHKF